MRLDATKKRASATLTVINAMMHVHTNAETNEEKRMAAV